MLLEGKNALVYGAGDIGAAVARGFAREGAAVFLASRTGSRAEEVAAAIRAAGGVAAASEVDALDEAQVEEFVGAVATQAGSVDVSFNLIGIDDVQGVPLTEISFDDYAQPLLKAVRSTFLTARAAARRMAAQGGGAILAFGGSSNGSEIPRDHAFGGLLVAFEAVEAMRRQFSAELGANGVRFVTLRTGGVPESIPAEFDGREEIERSLTAATLLGRTATLEDVGTVAAFVASDRARTMTAATVNVSAGALIDF
ncbi:MAG: SDR family oxidoreductase [Actinobacteria bacterium]|nr:SDR family oxidoreductase [Actinomycetota bacterium]